MSGRSGLRIFGDPLLQECYRVRGERANLQRAEVEQRFVKRANRGAERRNITFV